MRRVCRPQIPAGCSRTPRSSLSRWLSPASRPRAATLSKPVPRLTVSSPADTSEREADRVADSVMRMPDSRQHRGAGLTDTVYRPGSRRFHEAVPGRLKAKQTPGAGRRITPGLAAEIHSLSGGGQPLSSASRAYFEPRFGRRFQDIRIHDDTRAGQLAVQLNARAFTIGRDIVFARGQCQPGSREGRWLMAQELSHAMQQASPSQPDTIQRETAARRRPWQEVEESFESASGHPIRLFSHSFGGSTSLAGALQWIHDNSMARPTSFQFVSEEDTLRTAADEAYLTAIGRPLAQYQEVVLAWHWQDRRFTAYTIRHPASGAIDPRQRQDTIFVAHTHPTQTQVTGGGSSRVSWQTGSPSPEDGRNFHPQQSVSIICHRDPADNQTPMAFVYDRVGQVLSRHRGSGAFQSAGEDFVRHEAEAGTLGSSVGQYPRRRRRR
mgnify:CR=1 FL=1